MGNSGFFNDGTESIVFADNIQLAGTGPTVSPMFSKDGQLMIGSQTAPHVKMGTLKGTGGIIVNNSSGEIVLNFDPKFADPSVISTVFQSASVSDVIECNSVFTESNINNITSGTEILKLSVTPAYANSVFLITAYVIASRREGNIGLSLIKEGEATPLAFSVGYSSGYPNLCMLFYMLPLAQVATNNLSIRIGGVDSGPVVVNGMPNKNKLLSDTLSSCFIVQEAIRQQP